jgi:hypothetical protein
MIKQLRRHADRAWQSLTVCFVRRRDTPQHDGDDEGDDGKGAAAE